LAKYRFAGSLIEELRKSHADWQPAIVEYRGRKISEGILRIQERMSRQNDLTTDASRLPEVAPWLPESDAWSDWRLATQRADLTPIPETERFALRHRIQSVDD